MKDKNILKTGKYIAELERENKKLFIENSALRQELRRYRKLFTQIKRLEL